MRAVDYDTALGAHVQHLQTTKFGLFAGLNEHGDADVTWDDGQLTNTSVALDLIAEVQR